MTDDATGFADSCISLLTARGVVVHAVLLVISTVTISPSFKVLLEKVVLFVPTFVPFTFH